MARRTLLIAFILLAGIQCSLAQRELVPVDHPVYRFLLRHHMEGRINGFYWGMLPLSRHDVAAFLQTLSADSTWRTLTAADQGLLSDYSLEFSYDMTGSIASSRPFLPDPSLPDLLNDRVRRYFYAYVDSGTALFVDGLGSFSRRWSWGDSLGRSAASLGELGVRLRGTLHDRLGFYLQATNGRLLGGSHDLAVLEHRLLANRKFNSDERAYFDITKGYLRFDLDWMSVMAGREQLLWGMGYGDRAMFSDNTVPFDFVRIDLRSNSLRYAFIHGSLVGQDTSGHTLSSKYIAAHRIEFSFGRPVRIGFGEAVLYSKQPINFAMFNPLTFLTSAELSSEMPGGLDDAHNSLLWLDFEVLPVRDVRLFGSLLADDLKFGAFSDTSLSGNTNKLAWQGGIAWSSAFGVPTLLLSVEYSRINPFVLTHWTDVNSYTNWNLSLGPSLPPNSDEWMLGADVDVTPRLSAVARLRFQRSGENVTDASGRVIFDAGGDILHGRNHLIHPNRFLQGNRVNRSIATLQLDWQPILQYHVRFDGELRSLRYLATGETVNDAVAGMTLLVDY